MRLLLSMVVLVLSGCGTRATGPFGPLADRVDATATVRVIEHDLPSLLSTVSVTNPSRESVEFVVLRDCPVAVRLYGSAGEGEILAYDGGQEPCTRAGRTVRIGPGRSEVLRDTVRLADLSARGVVAGRYRAVAIVTAGPDAFEVPAGEVVIP